tara:strand:- start:2230 stop:2505 length:276 start_codon:yes stop_codon:yes gene_type:complete
MERFLKCENVEEVNEIIKEMNKEKYEKCINNSKMKSFLFSQINHYNFLEEDIRDQEEKLESIKNHKKNLENQIYSLTKLSIKDIKEFMYDK